MEEHLLTEMPKRYPINGTFELTVRCNLHCKMCLFRHDDSENEELKKKELTTEQWISLGKQAAEAGTLHLLITGGEPMLRPDFCDIWKGLYRMGFFLQLYTNATMVTQEIIETLRKYPPHKIGVTIYGISPETYQKACGNREAFKKTIEGIRQLMELPSLLEIRTTIIKENRSDLEKMEDFLRETFHYSGQLIHSDFVAKPVRGGSSDVAACRLEPEEQADLGIYRITRSINDYFDKKEIPTPDYKLKVVKRKDEKKEDRLTLFGCDAGMESYTIGWNGELLGCQLMEETGVNCVELGFEKAWEEYPFSIEQKEAICDHCKYQEKCTTCYAIRKIEMDGGMKCSEYCRRYAKRRMAWLRKGEN